MKKVLTIALVFICMNAFSYENRFDCKDDFLLLQFDSKTDVDDLHTIAAAHSILVKNDFPVSYLAVAGAWGIQDGLYIPSPDLFNVAFEENWLDANTNKVKAAKEVFTRIQPVLDRGGNIWVAEAGQSDFTSLWVAMIIENYPKMDIKERVTVVQHSSWNEEHTAKDKLAFVKANTNYIKIADGNEINNGTAGFKSEKVEVADKLIGNTQVGAVWQLAISLADEYNGLEGRYLNPAIAQGGLDFSDASELVWILNLDQLSNVEEFENWVVSN